MSIIGIDLGTTNSLAAVWRNGKSILIPNRLGKYLTPSVVSLSDDGVILTGEAAGHRLISHPEKTAALFKQYMGSEKVYHLGDIPFRPEDASAMILRAIKEDAQVFLGREIKEAIVSVPAYFNDAQRAATKAAGQLAGLKVERIINEPSAAALAYRQQDLRSGCNVVFDFGGGTLDVSVLESFENIVDILAVAGDNHLGGSDIDQAILTAFLREHPGLSGELSPHQREVLRETAEACKISLTDRSQVFMVYSKGEKEYAMALDNDRLMDICAPLLMRFKEILRRALQNAGLTLADVDNILLVGGSCRMPLIREYLRHLTQKPVLCDILPDYAVAVGLGVAAGIKERDGEIRDMVLTDICPFSLGVSTRKQRKDGVFDPIIPRNTALPASCVRQYTTVSDFQTSVDIDIYQGESLEAGQNLRLGRCSVSVPKRPAGEALVDIRFSYDLNGILEVEAHCLQNEAVARKLIVGSHRLSQDEIDHRLAELNRLKSAPRGEEENALTIARGQRLYEEFSGHLREEIAQRLTAFQSELQSDANPARIARIRVALSSYFDRLDEYSENVLFYGQTEDKPFYDEEDEML
ncbi:MAG: Hsp70 family protein [Oscillospiraceae bacterium]|nr:Hsp70 family protein [Oscillospiraceae bacterium]